MIVGIVGDMHEPFTHPHYLDFCKETFRRWRVDEVVFAGDIVDQHAMGFWESDPDGHSAADEGRMAVENLQAWKRAFKHAKVCIGNHDERHFRAGRKAGIPTRYLRDYAEVFETPDWDWGYRHVLDGTLYLHGTNVSGKYAAINQAIQRRTSLVMGHTHTYAGAMYHANDTSRIFGLQVGCGIDIEAYAFAYGKDFVNRPILGCGIVEHGSTAIFEPMPIGPREPFSRKRKC